MKTAVGGTSGIGEWYSVFTAPGFLFAGSRKLDNAGFGYPLRLCGQALVAVSVSAAHYLLRLEFIGRMPRRAARAEMPYFT